MAQSMYTKGKQEILTSGLFATGTEAYGLMLVGPSYTFNAAHDFRIDVTGELTLDDYSRQSIPSLAITTVGTTVGLTAGMVTFAGLGVGDPATTIDAGIVYRDTGNAATDWLLCYLDSITAVTAADDLIVTWDTEGIVYL